MRSRFVFVAALVGLALVPAVSRAQDKTFKPTLIVRVASLDEIIEEGRYLAGLAGLGEEAKQLEGFLKSMTGDKGLEGLDTKRPLGLYATLGPAVIDSPVVLVVPVADEKTFLATLERLKLKGEEGKEGVWTVEKGLLVPIYYRFANKYVYASNDKKALDKAKLPEPATVLPPDQVGTVSAQLNLGTIPKDLRDSALAQFELRVADLKDKKKPGESKEERALRGAVLDEVVLLLKSLFDDEGTVSGRFAIDRKAGDITLSASLGARDGSDLAKKLKALGQSSSVAAGVIGRDSAFSLRMTLALPDAVRKVLEPAVDDGLDQLRKAATDNTQRALVDRLVKAVSPTLKMGVLDAALDLRGPSQAETYTAVWAVQIKEGREIEKALREVLEKIPAEGRGPLKVDVKKVGAVQIHQVELKEGDLDPGTRKMFGVHPVSFALRDDALLVAMGENGLKALEEAVESKAVSGGPVRAEASLRRLAKLMAADQKAVEKAVEDAFKDPKADDKVVLSLEGTGPVELKLRLSGSVFRFLALVGEAHRKAGGK